MPLCEEASGPMEQKMKAKFKVGDKVRLNKRIPKYQQEELTKSTHTIASIGYIGGNYKAELYELHGVGKGKVPFLFRSYMLTPVKPSEQRKIGRPRTKRKYKRKQMR